MQLNVLGSVLVTLFDHTLNGRRPSFVGLARALDASERELQGALAELSRRGLVSLAPLRLTMPGLALAAALGRQCRGSDRASRPTLAA